MEDTVFDEWGMGHVAGLTGKKPTGSETVDWLEGYKEGAGLQNSAVTDAVDMAKSAGIDPKQFRSELRKQAFPWHAHNGRWTVVLGSPQHTEMQRVLDAMK